jgi:hypothetical protein
VRYGDAEALVVGVKQRGRGQMLGMGDLSSTITGVVDALTGGEATKVTTDVDTLVLEGQVLVLGGVLAGLAGLWSIWNGGRR